MWKKKYFNIIFGYNTTKNETLWIDVPSICKSRKEKDLILFDAIANLERKIKINRNYE